jgi:hypothetical protein
MKTAEEVDTYLRDLSNKELGDTIIAKGGDTWYRETAQKMRDQLLRSERMRIAEEARRAAEPKPSGDLVTGDGMIWWHNLVQEDTGPGGRPVRNLKLNNGYVIRNGTVVRHKGVSYLVEHDEDKSPYRVIRELQQFHDSLPPDAVDYQKAYAWLRGASPDDSYWQMKFNNPYHVSFAQAGDGFTRIWGREPSDALGPSSFHGALLHEFGHNVSNRVRDLRLDANSERWIMAARNDRKPVKPPGWVNRNLKKIDFHSDGNRDFAHGVTDYGKSSADEDYAESTSLYLAGIVGTLEENGKEEPVFFRDLFPDRAAVLDEVYPRFAIEQKARIRQLRGQA